MPEWPNGTDSKSVVLATVPRVRIPISPPYIEKPRNSMSYGAFCFSILLLISTTHPPPFIFPVGTFLSVLSIVRAESLRDRNLVEPLRHILGIGNHRIAEILIATRLSHQGGSIPAVPSAVHTRSDVRRLA